MEESGPPKKKIKSTNCVICNKLLSWEKAIKDPTQQDIRTLLDAAQLRQDDVYERLLPNHDDILNGSIRIAFHKSCRSSYTAKHNVQLAVRKRKTEASPSTNHNPDSDPHNKRYLRVDTPDSHIRIQCFICGSSYKRNEKLTQISTGTGSSTREHVLKAATVYFFSAWGRYIADLAGNSDLA